MKRMLVLFLLIPFMGWAATRLAAQGGPSQEAAAQTAPLEAFVLQVARLWAAGDAAALADLAPGDGRILLDVGDGARTVQGRHAAAALRAVFGERETVTTRPTRVTVAGGRPLRGFGELAWTYRPRGVSATQTATVFVGTVWEGDSWRVREVRLIR